MLPLIATVLPLGIAAAIHPTLIAIQLLLVSQPYWWRRARAFAIGAALPLISFGALAYFGFAQLPSGNPGTLNILGVSLRTMIGLGFLSGSVWLLWSHPRLQQRTSDFVTEKVRSGAPKDFLILGLLMNGKSVTTYALLVPALHDISTVGQPLPLKLLALAVLFGLALAPLWVPMVLAASLGSRGARRLQNMSDFVIANDFRLLGVMALVVGLYLTGSAAVLVAVVTHF
ncbi:MAG: GAP family protein [Actinomycetales bacterium]